MPIMVCGHANQGQANGIHVCLICIGLRKGADQVVDPQPSLDGRTAQCRDCRATRPSGMNLAFFAFCPSSTNDSFYCGCRGWD